ncbi:MAG: alpha/beta hydrolase [Myxococcota bacterium]
MRTWIALVAVGCASGPAPADDLDPGLDAGLDPGGTGSDPTGDPTVDTAAPTGDDDDDGAVGFPPVASFDDPGPFATVVDVVPGCTIHRPATLGSLGGGVGGLRHPVIGWGNGTATSPPIYAGLLSHLASHGFVVAAADTPNAGDGTEILACIDAVLALGDDPSSDYAGAIDGDRIGVSGHSQGGAGALMAAADPAVTCSAPVEPYITYIPLGGDFDRDVIGLQHAPMFLVSGGDDTIAIPAIHQEPVFDGASAPVTWALLAGATHFEPIGDGGAFRGPLTAWFRARLMDDPDASVVVDAPDCTLCAAPDWEIVSR